MNVTGVDFIAIPTQDFDRAEAFYADVLGLERSKRWGNMPAGEFENGTVTIALMQSDAFGLEFSSHSHPVAFQVDDVHAAREELEGKGVEFLTENHGWGDYRWTHFRGPDGNVYGITTGPYTDGGGA